MAKADEAGSAGLALHPVAPGVWAAPGAHIIDRTGRKMLPIGRDSFVPAVRESVVIDKTMLIADVLNSGYAVTLFCRSRRFGKTLNMTMMRAFFELQPEGDPNARDLARCLKAAKCGRQTAAAIASTRVPTRLCISISTRSKRRLGQSLSG